MAVGCGMNTERFCKIKKSQEKRLDDIKTIIRQVRCQPDRNQKYRTPKNKRKPWYCWFTRRCFRNFTNWTSQIINCIDSPYRVRGYLHFSWNDKRGRKNLPLFCENIGLFFRSILQDRYIAAKNSLSLKSTLFVIQSKCLLPADPLSNSPF